MSQNQLDTVYALAGEYLVHPDRRDRRRIEHLRGDLEETSGEFVDPLLTAGEDELLWSAREYVETLELSPPCPLYVGTYMFDEPETCRGAAVSDRNPYLLHLENLYRHFGFELVDDELPDFLPVMLGFLRVTDPDGRDENVAIRRYFVEEYLRPGLEPMHETMLDYESPYAGILETVREAVDRDRESMRGVPTWEPDADQQAARAPSCAERLDASSLPCCSGGEASSTVNRPSSREKRR